MPGTRACPGLDPGPGMMRFRAKKAQNSQLFMKTLEQNQSLKAVQFVKGDYPGLDEFQLVR
jgi:hypothetical protein